MDEMAQSPWFLPQVVQPPSSLPGWPGMRSKAKRRELCANCGQRAQLLEGPRVRRLERQKVRIAMPDMYAQVGKRQQKEADAEESGAHRGDGEESDTRGGTTGGGNPPECDPTEGTRRSGAEGRGAYGCDLTEGGAWKLRGGKGRVRM